MRGMIAIGVAIAGIMLIPTMAVSQDPEDAAEADRPSTDPDAIRCRNRAVTGSRARRIRVCMTNAEWEETRRSGNRDAATVVLDESRQSGFRGNCPPNC